MGCYLIKRTVERAIHSNMSP